MFHCPRIAIEAVPRMNWSDSSFGTRVVQIAGGAHFLSVQSLMKRSAAIPSGVLIAILEKSSVTILPPVAYRKLGIQRLLYPWLWVNAYCCFLAARSLSLISPNCWNVQASFNS